MKKYILLAITLFMMTNNALADELKGFKNGILLYPVALDVQDAYKFYKMPSDKTDITLLNNTMLLNYEKGLLSAIIAEQQLQGLSEPERKKLVDCLFDRPLAVFENLLFRYYEENKIKGEALYGSAFYIMVKNQCVK